MLKKIIFDRCINKEMSCKEGARFLRMHPKAFSRLKGRYEGEEGEKVLIPQKPGPRKCLAYNRTPENIEEIVVRLAIQHSDLGPMPLADMLFDAHCIRLHSTTVWRILKRRKIRYSRQYQRFKQDPKLYCLDTPGIELQMDACYPFGRSRNIAGFDAIDDCSRHVYGKIYEREDASSAIDFVKHLVQNVPFTVQRIRVDNRYGKELKEYCKSIGIEIIANDPYSPEQNGKIERFHKTLKREFFWKYCSFHDTKERMQYRYTLWQYYYNTQRRHGGYGMNRMTPQEKIASTLFLSLPNLLSAPYPHQKVTGTLQQYIF